MSYKKDKRVALNLSLRVMFALFAPVFVLPVCAFKSDDDYSVRRDAVVQKRSISVPERSAQQVRGVGKAHEQGVEVVWPSHRKSPSVIRGIDLGGKQALSGGKGRRVEKGAKVEDNAVSVMDDLSSIYGIEDAANEFALKSTDTDDKGFTHVRLNQTYRGFRVVGGELIVHFNKDGFAYEVTGQYVSGITLEVSARIKGGQAVQIALADLVSLGFPTGTVVKTPELVVYTRGEGAQLAYEFSITTGAKTPQRGSWSYCIDATSGAVLQRIDNIQRVSAPTTNGSSAVVTGTNLAGEGGVVTNVVGWHEAAGAYYLSSTNLWQIFDIAESGYPDANTYAYRVTSDWGGSDPVEMSAAINFDCVERYYRDVHKRKSFDNKSSLALANVHYGASYVNAYWDSVEKSFYIGDGDGEEANSLAVLDILGHEFTHGVTQFSCNLTYADESGALNESFSDIFGACVEFHCQPDDRASYPNTHPGMADWLLGEDCWLLTPALRDMRNPSNSDTVGIGNEQPSRYLGTYWYSGANQSYYVHQNSGVQNFFFYLLSDGGIGTNDDYYAYSFAGIGVTNAEKIAYRALTVYCTANTDYGTIADAWISAANDLNSKWVRTVKKAWYTVGCYKIGAPAFVMPNTLPNGRVGTPYSVSLGVVDGLDPYTWTMASGSLPPNLTFSDGVISGVPEESGTYSFTVSLEDDLKQTTNKTFTVTVQPPYSIPFAESFEHNGSSPDGWCQEFVSGPFSLEWKFMLGSPQGCPVSAYDGTYNACFVSTTNAPVVTRLISPRIDFGEGPHVGQLSFWHYMKKWVSDNDELRVYYKTSYSNNWVLLAAYTNTVSSWTKRTITLPDPSRSYYVAFAGTAKYGYGVCVDDVEIVDPTMPLTFKTGDVLPAATINEYYSQSLMATGGVSPYAFTIVSGALPAGMTLETNGLISGISYAISTNLFTVLVTDQEGAEVSNVCRLVVEYPRADLFFENFEHDSRMPSDWTQEFVTGDVAWCVSRYGANQQPAAAYSGNYNAILISSVVSNGVPLSQKTRLISPSINLGQAPTDIRLKFWHCMAAWGADQDELRVFYRTSASNAWIQIAAYTSNVPEWTQQTLTLPDPTTTYFIAFEGNAKFGCGVCIDDVEITDTTEAPVIITPDTLTNGVINIPYSQALTAVGGETPYTWMVVSNSLPMGLNLDTDTGVISGTPAEGGSFAFRIKVTGNGKSTTSLFTLHILDAIPLPFFEPFENGGAIPYGWSQYNVSNSGPYSAVSWVEAGGSKSGVPSAAYSGGYNANLFRANGYPCVTRLVTPMLNLDAHTNTVLTFWLCMKEYVGSQDQLRIYYRTTSSNSWVLLSTYTNNISSWTQETVSLPEPSSSYYLAFEGTTRWGYGVCVDNVSVTGDPVITKTPYELWMESTFSSSDISAGLNLGPSDDFDGDGIANGLEYAYGLDPTVSDTAGLPFGGVKDNHLFWTYHQNKSATDVTFLVEACTSLLDHAWTTVDVSELSRNDSNTWYLVTVIHDVAVTNYPIRFLRLKVTVP